MDQGPRALPALLLYLASLLMPASLASQSTPASSDLLRASSVDGRNLRGGIWAYDIVVKLDGEDQQVGTRVLMIDPVDHSGRPGWLLVEISRSGAADVIDSLVLDRVTLEPIHRSLRMGPTVLVADFDGDSIRGTLRSMGGESSFGAKLPTDAIINAGMLEAVVRLHELRPGWSRRAELFVLGPSGQSHSVPTELVISGVEQISVPAGDFAAWAATATADGAQQRLWLSRDAHVVLRSSTASPQLPGALIETVLTREELAP